MISSSSASASKRAIRGSSFMDPMLSRLAQQLVHADIRPRPHHQALGVDHALQHAELPVQPPIALVIGLEQDTQALPAARTILRPHCSAARPPGWAGTVDGHASLRELGADPFLSGAHARVGLLAAV